MGGTLVRSIINSVYADCLMFICMFVGGYFEQDDICSSNCWSGLRIV